MSLVFTAAFSSPQTATESATNYRSEGLMHAFTEKGVQSWTRKFCAKSVWRFHGEHDANDLMSEAWLVFDRVAKKYGDITIKHFMSLYQRSLINRFNNLAKQSRYRENLCDIDNAVDMEAPTRPFVEILMSAPPDVRDAIAALMQIEPTLLTEHLCRRRETYNERFYRIIENAPRDIATKIRDFLHGNEYANDINPSTYYRELTMSEKQNPIAELLAAIDESIAAVDVTNPVNVELFLSNLVLAAGNLSNEKFEALSPQARAWVNETTNAYNANQNLAEVALEGYNLQPSDLPTTTPTGAAETPPDAPKTRPDAPEGDDPAVKAAEDDDPAETPPPAPVSKPAAGDKKPKVEKAFSKRNAWGDKTKAKAVINAVILSNGEAAHDISLLAESIDGEVSDISVKLSVTHALQAFDCMRQAGWLDMKNPAVQSFIKSIDEV